MATFVKSGVFSILLVNPIILFFTVLPGTPAMCLSIVFRLPCWSFTADSVHAFCLFLASMILVLALYKVALDLSGTKRKVRCYLGFRFDLTIMT